MEKLNYCRRGIRGGCYFEFQMGDYFFEEKHWLKSSLFLDEDMVNELNLGRLFLLAIPDFDYFGPTRVNREQWTRIKQLSMDMSPSVQAVIDEIHQWAQGCFQSEECFTILGV